MKIARLMLAAALLAGGAAVLKPHLSAAPESASSAPAQPAARRLLQFPTGEERLYRLSLKRTQVTDLFQARQEGELSLEGTLRLRLHGQVGGRARLSLSFPELTAHRFVVMGQDALADASAAAAQLQDTEAWLEVDARGALAGLGFAPNATPVFRAAVRGLVHELFPVLPDPVLTDDTTTWHTAGASALGLAETEWARLDDPTPGRVSIERSRETYTRLDAAPPAVILARQAVTGEVRFTVESGRVIAVEGTEGVQGWDRRETEVVSAATEIELALLATGSFRPDPQAALLSDALVLPPPETPEENPALERRLLESRVAGLTMDQLTDDLLEFGHGGQLPDHNRWLWRATGLLLLEPARCAQLEAVFTDPYLNHESRALLLDLLTNAGHTEAQASLRKLLSTEAAKRDAGAAALYQRLALLESPDAETAAYATERFASAEPGARGAEAVTLGAIAGQRARGGDPAGAREANTRLRQALETSDDTQERAHLVLALGNAGLNENVGALQGLTADADPGVRAAVATALRKTPGEAAERALLGLLADRDAGVQLAAAEALGRQEVTDGLLSEVRARVSDGRVQLDAIPGVVSLLTPHRESPEARATLQAMLQRRDLDPVLANRIRGLL